MDKDILTNEFIDKVLRTAFEGGINHWCDKIRVRNNDFKGGKYASDVISRGGILDMVFDIGNSYLDIDEYSSELTKDKLIEGYGKYKDWAKENNLPIYTIASDFTKQSADALVQCAVFGQVAFKYRKE